MKENDLYWLEGIGICRVKDLHLKDVSFEILESEATKKAQQFAMEHNGGFSMTYKVIDYDLKHGAARKLDGVDRAIKRLK